MLTRKRKLSQGSNDEPKPKRKPLERKLTVELEHEEKAGGFVKSSSSVDAAVENADPVLSVRDRKKLRKKLSSILAPTACK